MWTSLQTLNLDKVLLASSAKQGKDQELAFLGALAGLFQNNVTPDFLKLYEERGERFTKTTIPNYPFQRQRHYPAFIPSRTASSPHIKSESATTEIPTEHLVVDQPLCDLLHDHRIEGRRVIPGVAFADFLARLGSNPSRSVESVRFHQPLVLESTNTLVQAMFDQDGSFRIYQNGSLEDKDKLCSGTLALSASTLLPKDVSSEVKPTRVLTREEVYAPFESNIYFGPNFSNVAEIRMWPDHVDALIIIEPSQYSDLDRIRRLDPCLHMFGAVTQFEEVPDYIRTDGFFLPTSLEGFVLHTESLPSSIICRYHLPLAASKNFRAVSVAFEVFSLSGELLVSCRKYSVAWIPKGVAIQAPSRPLSHQWLRNTWRPEELRSNVPSLITAPQVDVVAYFGNSFNPDLLQPFSASASQAIFVEFGVSERWYLKIPLVYEGLAHLPVRDASQGLFDELVGKSVSIILDVTSCNPAPGSLTFSAFWKHVLWMMKLTLNGKIHISSFVVVSCMSAPANLGKEGSPPTLGAIVQGIIRVYRREAGLGRDVVWGVDLPAQLAAKALQDIIEAEMSARRSTGPTSSSIVAYRYSDNDTFVTRLVPVLMPMPKQGHSSTTVSGVTVIIGMGSIGTAIASSFVAAGSNAVIFVGRRPQNDLTVRNCVLAVLISVSCLFY